MAEKKVHYFYKRNIHHPKLKFAGKDVPWEKYSVSSGSLATDDSKLVEFLQGINTQYPNAVKELTPAEWDILTKKNEIFANRRTLGNLMAPGSKFRIPPSHRKPSSSGSPGQRAGAAAAVKKGVPPKPPQAEESTEVKGPVRRSTAIESQATIEKPPSEEEVPS